VALGDGVRRNIAHVSQAERDHFLAAILQLDTTKLYPDGVSYWDKQEAIHKNAHAAGQDVHSGPAFVPWHRELCNRFEALLREVDSELSLHYWDWTTDPRATPDGKGGVVNLFTPQFMGGVGDPAGPPLQNFESTELGHLLIWRQIAPGAPQVPSDASILNTPDFPTFDNNSHPAHDTCHGYIGGSLRASHFSFEDPFVFLLHSNLDRLWAEWQTAPGHPERLDPNQTYGVWGVQPEITEALQPWAGNVGAGVAPLRPWAAPDNRQVVKNCKDPSVVIPPPYDTCPPDAPNILRMHVCALTDDGGMWHTIRENNAAWQAAFGDVKGQSGNPGHFTAVGCAAVRGELQVCALTNDGGMWHTIRYNDIWWQPAFGDVKGQSGNPGHFTAVACAGTSMGLNVSALTDDGGIWHTIRYNDVAWQSYFGDVTKESGSPGFLVAVGCGGVG
jgi:hypothetical protein